MRRFMFFLSLVSLAAFLLAVHDVDASHLSTTLRTRNQAQLTRNSYKEAAARAMPAVVSIYVREVQGFSPLAPQSGPSGVMGSGVIADVDGYIITNKHVVSGNIRDIKIVISTGESFPAVLAGVAPDTDIAILKATAPPEKMAPADFRDSDSVEPAEIVVAIGSPLGLQNSVTHGIVSAVRMMANSSQVGALSYPLIQTDASINPGNSGGPLIDLDGKVIGINTFGLTTRQSGGTSGLNFAIPSNVAKMIYEQVKRGGSGNLGWIGVTVQDISQDLVGVFGLPADARCVVITGVAPGGPAASAGLKQGDCVEAVDGKPQKDAASFEWLIRNSSPGSEITLAVRSKKNPPRQIAVTVKKRQQKESP